MSVSSRDSIRGLRCLSGLQALVWRVCKHGQGVLRIRSPLVEIPMSLQAKLPIKVDNGEDTRPSNFPHSKEISLHQKSNKPLVRQSSPLAACKQLEEDMTLVELRLQVQARSHFAESVSVA